MLIRRIVRSSIKSTATLSARPQGITFIYNRRSVYRGNESAGDDDLVSYLVSTGGGDNEVTRRVLRGFASSWFLSRLPHTCAGQVTSIGSARVQDRTRCRIRAELSRVTPSSRDYSRYVKIGCLRENLSETSRETTSTRFEASGFSRGCIREAP